MLAGESHRVWQGISFHDWVELDSVMEEVSLGVRRPGAAEVEEARRLLPADSRRRIYAKETLALAGYPDQVTAPVQAIRIGGYIPTVSGHRDGGYETWRASRVFSR